MRLVLLALGTGVSARDFLRVQSCEREKQRAGGLQAPGCSQITVHAQKACRRPQTGGPVDKLESRAAVLQQAAEMGQQEPQEYSPHRGIEKMGPGSSQGAWWEEINGHKNWREVQTASEEKLTHHENSQTSVA